MVCHWVIPRWEDRPCVCLSLRRDKQHHAGKGSVLALDISHWYLSPKEVARTWPENCLTLNEGSSQPCLWKAKEKPVFVEQKAGIRGRYCRLQVIKPPLQGVVDGGGSRQRWRPPLSDLTIFLEKSDSCRQRET